MAETTSVATFMAQLQCVAMIARLRSDLPVPALLEIGDALLAAPILLVEVAMDFADAAATIVEFRQRYGEHLLVGAAAIHTLAQLATAKEAGAHFFALPTLDPKLLRFGREQGLFCIPQVSTPVQAKLARLEGCPLVAVTGEQLLHFPPLAWHQAAVPIILEGDDASRLADWQAAGVTAIRVGKALFPNPAWSHAAIIIRARQLRQTWEAASNDFSEKQ